MNTRLEKFYKDTVVPKLMEKFGYDNVMQVPRITKITLNMGVGEAVGNKKILENAVADMAKIAGQKPVITKARVSVASFKIRDGWPIGCKVTLRRAKMYEFLDRLINVSLPRVRDFRGVSGRSFDGRGNYNMGVKEQIIFPEIDFDAGRRDARHGHRHHHHRQDRRGSQGAARSLQLPVPQLIDRTRRMAKTSMVNRDIKRKKLVKKHATKRAALKKTIASSVRLVRGEDGRRDQAAEAAARLLASPRAQPLRTDRPLARRVLEVRPRPQQAARSHHAWRRAGPAQGQLVTAGPGSGRDKRISVLPISSTR